MHHQKTYLFYGVLDCKKKWNYLHKNNSAKIYMQIEFYQIATAKKFIIKK
ncbi:Uncharacterised protein [Prevotella pallens]|uniref:Uncharacterized protein n=1 Tax=Prevotella pallens TaxID=60133 RepID=A0A379GBS1_9BACT|nr:Uncharacterised protein [Prevotella pallens]